MTENNTEKTGSAQPSVETPWLTTAEAAAYLRRSVETLHGWRAQGKGPPWYQPHGHRGGVVYHRDEIDAWQRGQPSEAAPQ